MQARISRLKSIGPPEDPAPPKTASVSAGRRWIWRGVTFGFLIIGLTGSCLAAAGWTSSQRTRNAREFTGRAANIASAVGESIQRAVDLQRSFGQLVATTPDPTNATLVPWLTSLDIPNTYPGSTGMTVVEPVPASALPAYQQSVAVDPVAGYGRGPYAVYPPGERPRYCLSRFGLIMQATAEPAGIDLCAPDIFGVANILPGVLDRATESNLPQFVGFASIMDPLKRVLPPSVYRTYRQQFLVTVPVYAGGSPPPLSVPRQSALVGWVVSDFEGDTMMDAAVPNAGGTFIRLTVDGQTMASLGPTARPSWQSRTMPLPIGLGLSLTVAQARTTAPTTQGVVLGSLGALLTFLLFVIGYGFGRSRERALRLVDERTEDLRFQALHDTLTGLPNRALLFDRAEQILARARRQPKAVGALYLDIDNFKDVNDSLGHSAGDELLKAVADRLQETVRESDTVGRLGGDEFLILTEDDATDAGPEMVAERVLAVLQEPFLLPGEDPVTLRIGASIGVAAGVRATAEELIRDADVALYQAKESGKARTATFRPEMQLAIHNRLSLEMDLGQALERHELFLEYQPIFDLARMSTTAVEALLRWRHPTRGVVAPAEFIPVAEQSGLMIPIGAFVLDEACSQLASWESLGYHVGVAVNVSMLQLESDGFVDMVREVIEGKGIDAHQVTLEITESVLSRDPVATTEILTALKAIGVRIAIDDFGTGYSSLAYLRQFPIDSLKIDRSFIGKAASNAQSSAIVHTLVQLGKALEIETLAEGIEDRSQLTALQRERCDSGQGFFYSRPLPPEELVPFFARSGLDPESARTH